MFAQAVAVKLDAMSIVDDPVEDGVGDGGVTEVVMTPPSLIAWCVRSVLAAY